MVLKLTLADHKILLFLAKISLFAVILSAAQESPAESFATREECIRHIIQSGPDTMTLGEARASCSTTIPAQDDNGTITTNADGPVNERLQVDDTNIMKPFTLMSHRNNYILLAAHNFQGWDPAAYAEAFDDDDITIDNTEVQFQLSIKTPLALNLFDKHIDLFAGYTVRSFWQFYNSDFSSPFRETNHEPEIWLQTQPENVKLFGFKNTINGLGFNHMSNGRGGSLSRSWNRVYGMFAFERDNLAVMFSPWFRIEEDLEDDDNPDITDFYGHGSLLLVYKYNEHNFSLMTRNNLESGFSHGAVEVGWSFPIFDYPYLRGYLQYFSGYGESLIDYDRYVNRIGIGLQLTEML